MFHVRKVIFFCSDHAGDGTAATRQIATKATRSATPNPPCTPRFNMLVSSDSLTTTTSESQRLCAERRRPALCLRADDPRPFPNAFADTRVDPISNVIL